MPDFCSYFYKIITIGSKVGKTCLINRILKNEFNGEVNGTYGRNYHNYIISQRGDNIRFNFIDITGSEIYFNLYKSSIPRSDCILLLYDITDIDSFNIVKSLYQNYVKKYKEKKLIYIIGNKIDLFEKQEVFDKDVIKFAKENNFRFFKISCKINIGLKEFYIDFVNEISRIKSIWDKNNM